MSPRRWLIVNLGLAVLVVAAAVLSWRLDHPSLERSTLPEVATDGHYRVGTVSGDTSPAVEAATSAVPAALSYDFAHLDRSLAAATSTMTVAFAQEFRTTFEASVRPLATKEEAVSQARVRAAGAVGGSGDAGDNARAVTVLVFVDQVLVSSKAMTAGHEPAKVGQTRVLVRMVPVGHTWKVDDLRPL